MATAAKERESIRIQSAIDPDSYELITKQADDSCRSFSKQVEWILKQHLMDVANTYSRKSLMNSLHQSITHQEEDVNWFKENEPDAFASYRTSLDAGLIRKQRI